MPVQHVQLSSAARCRPLATAELGCERAAEPARGARAMAGTVAGVLLAVARPSCLLDGRICFSCWCRRLVREVHRRTNGALSAARCPRRQRLPRPREVQVAQRAQPRQWRTVQVVAGRRSVAKRPRRLDRSAPRVARHSRIALRRDTPKYRGGKVRAIEIPLGRCGERPRSRGVVCSRPR